MRLSTLFPLIAQIDAETTQRLSALFQGSASKINSSIQFTFT